MIIEKQIMINKQITSEITRSLWNKSLRFIKRKKTKTKQNKAKKPKKQNKQTNKNKKTNKQNKNNKKTNNQNDSIVLGVSVSSRKVVFHENERRENNHTLSFPSTK